jgi:hypothetical protein
MIPEHFIWRVFQSLTDALTACHEGTCIEKRLGASNGLGQPAEDWHPILHLDIKAGNVLLGRPDAKYPYYKNMVLTDFDLAVRVDSDPARQRAQFDQVRNVVGSIKRAPELSSAHKRETQRTYTPKGWTLDDRTDIYALGSLIRHMMCCTLVTFANPYELEQLEAENFLARSKGGMKDTELEFPWTSYPDVYSTGLVKLVIDCLSFAQERRPDLPRLRERVDDNFARHDSTYGAAAEVSQAADNANHPLHVLVPREDPRYQLGAVFDAQNEKSAKDFVHSKVTTAEKADTRHVYEPYKQLLTLDAIPADSRLANHLPVVAAEAMESALNDVSTAIRARLISKEEETEDQRIERERSRITLDHATSTITKCVNPHGTFQQYVQKQDVETFEPIMKNRVMHAIKSEAERRMKIIKRTKNLGADENKERVQAFQVLCEAMVFSRCLLVLGQEEDIDESTFDEGWVGKLPEVHRGVWDYFWSRPDIL